MSSPKPKTLLATLRKKGPVFLFSLQPSIVSLLWPLDFNVQKNGGTKQPNVGIVLWLWLMTDYNVIYDLWLHGYKEAPGTNLPELLSFCLHVLDRISMCFHVLCHASSAGKHCSRRSCSTKRCVSIYIFMEIKNLRFTMKTCFYSKTSLHFEIWSTKLFLLEKIDSANGLSSSTGSFDTTYF